MNKIDILKLDTIDSTNLYAMQNLGNLKDKQVIVADYQTAGKGTHGRKWISDNSRNACVSIVLKPEIENYPYSNLTQYLSAILCEVLEEKYKVKPEIKWPNDIFVEGAKMAGILCEAKNKNNKIEALVLGFGVNLNMDKDELEKIDQKATSLKVLLDKDIDVEEFIKSVLERFFGEYESFSENGFKYIKDRYIKKCNFIGQNIKIRSNEGFKEYFAHGVNDDGTLTVLDKDNKKINIISGGLL